MSDPLWPHQKAAISDVHAALTVGERRVCVTSPTGGGKTRMQCELIIAWCGHGHRVALYTNRRMLLDQLHSVLTENGIAHGVRAAGWRPEPDLPVQLCMAQTEATRGRQAAERGSGWRLHPATRVIVDEAHLNAGGSMVAILEAHLKAGAALVGFTATPVDIGHLYDHLIVAGTTSELRACGALVQARHFAPDEPDLRNLRLTEGEELTQEQNRKAIMRPGLIGRVWEWFQRLNPERTPTLLFAPGVNESIWFAQQFRAKGVRAAHIDGEDVWLDGELIPSSQSARQDVMGMSRDGQVVVLCNRFVLREGVDAPWLRHGIFATVFGALPTYLQSGGRLLRATFGKDDVVIQDHGGNWLRHGSVNADRVWELGMSAAAAGGVRADRLRAGEEREPLRCPSCSAVLVAGHCPECGADCRQAKRSRIVVAGDGSLHEVEGSAFKPRRVSREPDGPAKWKRMYYRSRKRGATFRQAFALYAYENGWAWPDPSWPLMPTRATDHWRRVGDVDPRTLTGGGGG